MTAYPVTCLVDQEDGFRAVLTLEDGDPEAGSIARVIVHTERPTTELRVELSLEAAVAFDRRAEVPT